MTEKRKQEFEPVLEFWYSEPMCNHWFSATPEIDAQIRQRFEALWQRAAGGEFEHWQETAEGCLALSIVLDQFPLNMYRGQAKSFATEAQAVCVSKNAIAKGYLRQLDKDRVAFLIMPLMHSENLEDQQLSVQSFERLGLQDNLRFARHHRDLVARFGRFPHRNSILGRSSSEEELVYLASDQAFNG